MKQPPKRPRKAWAVVNERGVFCCALPTKLEAIDCIACPSERVIPVLIVPAPIRKARR